eukprot:TRINITY_DN16853_c0_g1_i2.p1 TRINITY_DN16853_c0_g1~~TRINITY_DN16853_c0_g1_i2.p1  ORF type:complete len:329 (-),score=33.72 TRINITY_DN16853_c0_g1_i2:4-990(-)
MVSSLEEFPEWVHEKLQAQSSFTFGISCIFAGIILRQRKFLRTEDSLPISKLTFNLFFPALLCVKTWKTPLSSDLWPVGLVSFVVHLMICVCVFVLSGCIPIRNPKSGFRGQLILCLQGCNIGFTYPLVLASTHLAETVFPRLLLWDLCGNSPLVLFMNYIIAMKLAPVKNEEERRRILQESTQVPVEVIGATSDRGDQSEAKTSARPRLSSKGHIEESKQQLPKPKEPEDKGEEAPVSRSQADSRKLRWSALAGMKAPCPRHSQETADTGSTQSSESEHGRVTRPGGSCKLISSDNQQCLPSGPLFMHGLRWVPALSPEQIHRTALC